MRTVVAAALALAALTAAPQAAPCRSGTNMPAGDANPAKRTDPNQNRMVCEEGSLKTIDGTGKYISDVRTWSFSLRDKDGNKVDNSGKRIQ